MSDTLVCATDVDKVRRLTERYRRITVPKVQGGTFTSFNSARCFAVLASVVMAGLLYRTHNDLARVLACVVLVLTGIMACRLGLTDTVTRKSIWTQDYVTVEDIAALRGLSEEFREHLLAAVSGNLENLTYTRLELITDKYAKRLNVDDERILFEARMAESRSRLGLQGGDNEKPPGS